MVHDPVERIRPTARNVTYAVARGRAPEKKDEKSVAGNEDGAMPCAWQHGLASRWSVPAVDAKAKLYRKNRFLSLHAYKYLYMGGGKDRLGLV